MLGPVLLFAIVFTVVAKIAHAAQCCGYRGDLAESALWQARQNLCQNPWSNQPIDGGYEANVDGYFNGGSTTYVFWGTDGSNAFANCWQATQNMVEQCARAGFGAASWSAGSETYAMSATASGYRKRDGNLTGSVSTSVVTVEELPPLPNVSGTLPELRLSSGTYQVLGIPVNIQIQGVKLDGYDTQLRRDLPSLNTTYGPTEDFNRTVEQHIDLSAMIESAVADATASSTTGASRKDGEVPSLSRRSQQCQTSSGHYAMVDAGYWQQAWELSSGCMMCGQNVPCSYSEGWSKTWSQSFSIGIDGGLADDIVQAALSIGFQWQRSYTRSNEIGCTWETGVCHTYWTQQPMVWQRGFVVNTYASEWSIDVGIQFVHSDAPRGEPNRGCFSGCCGGARPSQCNNDFCQWAFNTPDTYGVCNNWDAIPPQCWMACRASRVFSAISALEGAVDSGGARLESGSAQHDFRNETKCCFSNDANDWTSSVQRKT